MNKSKQLKIKIDQYSMLKQARKKIIIKLKNFLKELSCDQLLISEATIISIELITNIQKYADLTDKQLRERPLKITAQIIGNRLKMEFLDPGIKFNPVKKHPAKNSKLKPGGRGLTIIKNISKKITYERINNNQNKLTVFLPLCRPEAVGEQPTQPGDYPV